MRKIPSDWAPNSLAIAPYLSNINLVRVVFTPFGPQYHRRLNLTGHGWCGSLHPKRPSSLAATAFEFSNSSWHLSGRLPS